MDTVMTMTMNIVIDTLEIPTLNITAGNRLSFYLSTSFFDISIFFLDFSHCLILRKGSATKSDEFSENCQRGGEVTFNPKTYVADFGLFDHEIDTK